MTHIKSMLETHLRKLEAEKYQADKVFEYQSEKYIEVSKDLKEKIEETKQALLQIGEA